MNAAHLRDASEPPQDRSKPPGNGNGVHGYRLDALEKRLEKLESNLGDINNRTIAIESKLDNVATKNYVLWIFVVTMGVSIFGLLGHLLIRNLSN